MEILQERPYLMTSSTEEPHLEEAKVPEEIPNEVRLAIMRVHKNLEHPSKELLCRALRNGGANRIAIRAASQLKCDACSENKPPKSHLPAKLADTYTEFNQGVGVDLFVLADSDEQVCKFLNIVDLATRFNICFPVPSKGPDDVLSVLELVWISWAGPTNHLISDMGGEFEGELGEFTEAHGIRQYFTASEDPWQNGLVERNGGIWKAAVRKAIKDVGARGFVEMRRLACNARINSSGYSPA